MLYLKFKQFIRMRSSFPGISDAYFEIFIVVVLLLLIVVHVASVGIMVFVIPMVQFKPFSLFFSYAHNFFFFFSIKVNIFHFVFK